MTHLFDAHCHPQDPRLDWREAGIRAEAAGVAALSACGTSEADWPALRALSASDPRILPSYGLHPWFVGSRGPDWLRRLEDLLSTTESGSPDLPSIGEIGLDLAIPSPHADQDPVFRAQLDLARQRERPASIHGVHAWGRVLEIVEGMGPFPGGLLLHAWSGPTELVPRFARQGAFFSIAGTVLRPHATRVRQAARTLPSERLLIETDSPDLAPPGITRMEPAHLRKVLQEVATLRCQEPDDLAAILWCNAKALFRWAR